MATWARKLGWLEAGFALLTLSALVMRLWELGGRVMHYDEAIHLHQSWQLSNLVEYIHSPWMHGPFQIELTALVFMVLGDSDFTARLGYAVFGTALVAVPYFLRRHLGSWGALFTGVMLAASPALLYFSRFGRNDILMAFWAAALLTLFWKYNHEERDRYLYLASAVLALMFATKETAYFVALIFGGLAFLLGLPQIAEVAGGRAKLGRLAGPAGFFLLLVTLTLPQWSAMAGMLEGVAGLTLISRDGVNTGIVGAPFWGGQQLTLPVTDLHPTAQAVVALLVVGGAGIWGWVVGLRGRRLATGVGPILALPVAVGMALNQPFGIAAADMAGAVVVLGVGVGLLLVDRRFWRTRLTTGLALGALTALYGVLLTPVVNVGGVVRAIVPLGTAVDTTQNGIPINYVVALGIVGAALLVSVAVGLAWKGRVWLGCAGVFYLVWVSCYTTLFTNWGGVFSGVWQGMGYWIAQQDVARGNQPWYYYFVELSVYETLPVVFGVIAAVYFFKKADTLGLVLAVWAGLTLLAYTVASEKMPWLVVNITLPFIFLAGKFLGELVEKVRWKAAVRRGTALILFIAPLGMAIGVFLLDRFARSDGGMPGPYWVVILGLALFAVVWASLVKVERRGGGMALTGLGAAGLLLGFTLWTGVRAAYTYDDSNREILAYAQGSADLFVTYERLQEEGIGEKSESPLVLVDYDVWYPFQWYVRNEAERGTLGYRCFKSEGSEGWNASCNPPAEQAGEGSLALMVSSRNLGNDDKLTETHDKSDVLRDLLWFPESYRRPGENRMEESPWEELAKDGEFFREQASSRQVWREVIGYILSRDLKRDWYAAEFHIYTPQQRN